MRESSFKSGRAYSGRCRCHVGVRLQTKSDVKAAVIEIWIKICEALIAGARSFRRLHNGIAGGVKCAVLSRRASQAVAFDRRVLFGLPSAQNSEAVSPQMEDVRVDATFPGTSGPLVIWTRTGGRYCNPGHLNVFICWDRAG